MVYQLNSVAMHITNECSHRCPMCYATPEGQIKCEGDINTLKLIADELRKANVQEINLVGGDPAQYSKVRELAQYLSILGFRLSILSNTHNYRNSSIGEMALFVTSLESTIHGPNPQIHDSFCQKDNAYHTVINNLKVYSTIKSEKQKLGIAVNIMRHNYNLLYATIESLLEQGLSIDYVMIQRIGSYGKALGTNKYDMLSKEIIKAFQEIDRINRQLGIETSLIDAYPYCIIPEEYHQYLSKCDWGYNTAAIDMNGNLSRCALSTNYTLGNVLTTPVNDIWQNSSALIDFRNKKYLRQDCQVCDKLEKCGGGCAMSCGDGVLSTDSLMKKLRY